MNLSELIVSRILDSGDLVATIDEVVQLGLNPAFWSSPNPPCKIDSEVRRHLLNIAQDFVSDFKVHRIKLEDIRLTGSSANYDWTPASDLDLHLIVDFKKVNRQVDLVAEYFHELTAIWNEAHQIFIKSYPVELYVQDYNEP